MWEDLAKEDKKDETFLNSFVELPKLNPGDAVFFNGFTYHRPIPYCRGGCTKSNSRRMTLRYIDGERTKFRADVPTQATYHQVRWCPSWPFRFLLGEECRIKAGMLARDTRKLPIVIELDKARGGRKIPTDGLTEEFSKPDPWSYFFGKLANFAIPRTNLD